jgi:hypothetical protein
MFSAILAILTGIFLFFLFRRLEANTSFRFVSNRRPQLRVVALGYLPQQQPLNSDFLLSQRSDEPLVHDNSKAVTPSLPPPNTRHLTTEQIAYMDSLYAHNAPTTEIAAVLERMRAERKDTYAPPAND